MKQLAKCLSLVLLGSAAMAAGCSTTAPGAGNDGGGLMGAGGSTSNLHLLPVGPTGYVSDVDGTPNTGIKGAWYAYGDGIGSDGTTGTGDCESKGSHAVAECSSITAPSFGSFPNTAGKMCTSGTVAKVIPIVGMTALDYNEIWGAGIGVDLNNAGGDAGAVKGTYNATTAGVLGIAFDIDAVPLATLRVEFPNATATNAAFWGGDLQASPVKVGHNEIKWADVKGPFYDTTAPVFDPKTIYSIQFHVPAAGAAAATYNFCISNLSAILAKAP